MYHRKILMRDSGISVRFYELFTIRLYAWKNLRNFASDKQQTTMFVEGMKNIPKIILDEAERQGLDRMAAYLCDLDGREIYSLGVEDKEHWFPSPPNAPVLISLKDGKVSEFNDFWSIYDLLNRDEN